MVDMHSRRGIGDSRTGRHVAGFPSSQSGGEVRVTALDLNARKRKELILGQRDPSVSIGAENRLFAPDALVANLNVKFGTSVPIYLQSQRYVGPRKTPSLAA